MPTCLKILEQEHNYLISLIVLWKNHPLWLKATLGAEKTEGDVFAKLILLISGMTNVIKSSPFYSNATSLMEQIAEIQTHSQKVNNIFFLLKTTQPIWDTFFFQLYWGIKDKWIYNIFKVYIYNSFNCYRCLVLSCLYKKKQNKNIWFWRERNGFLYALNIFSEEFCI